MKNRRLAAAPKGMVAAVVVCAVLLGIVWLTSGRSSDVIQSEFSSAVDLSALSNIAVQHNGRLKSFNSYARTMTKFVTGPRLIHGQPSEFTYLDMMFRPDVYDKAEVIYVKPTIIRRRRLVTYAQVQQDQEAAARDASPTGNKATQVPQPVGAGKSSRK